ncbi:LLM class flavin-dependent oxidoreductase [Streptomyces sp. NPDC093808]|uniref:LLM class flavin-dependent oxidoreductase n=1 Tax=Streptomyces sp. NPDC093808 TaxID=3154985 RepID=UPI00344E17A0
MLTPTGSDCDNSWPANAAFIPQTSRLDEQRSYDDGLDHDERYNRTGEFLHLLHTVWRGEPYGFESDHYRVSGGCLRRLPPPSAPPPYAPGRHGAGASVRNVNGRAVMRYS